MTEPRPVEEIAREIVDRTMVRVGRETYGACLLTHSAELVLRDEIAAALTAERQRAETDERERDEATAHFHGMQARALTAEARIDALEAALLAVIGSSFEFDDSRIGYVTLQVDRGDIGHARALLDTKQAS